MSRSEATIRRVVFVLVPFEGVVANILVNVEQGLFVPYDVVVEARLLGFLGAVAAVVKQEANKRKFGPQGGVQLLGLIQKPAAALNADRGLAGRPTLVPNPTPRPMPRPPWPA